MDPSISTPADQGPVQAALRSLPSVDHLLSHPAVAPLSSDYPRSELVFAIRTVLDRARVEIRAGEHLPVESPARGRRGHDVASLALEIRSELFRRSRPHLQRVINATGIVLHTGLGRAPLAEEAVSAVVEVASGYCNLELDLDSGQRGDRHEHVRAILRELTGGEDALVVNNNAAATYLTLYALTAGREVVISRGELVEIGGSYRMPDIMAAAGCRMVEVGTTNRTRLRDYERALTAETAALLRVHTSNYRIQGFVESASLAELAGLARERNLVLIDDLGSGLLTTVPPANSAGSTEPALAAAADWDEPTVRDSVAGGADVTLFSGDKLLGGPQAGVIIGRSKFLARMRADPLMRTLRPDKLTLAALEATLRLYRDPGSLARRLPAHQMLRTPLDALERAADALAERIRASCPAASVTCEPGESYAGGGSLPTAPFPTIAVVVRVPAAAPGELAARLRKRETPIVCRVQDDALVFDCRTLMPGDAEQIPPAIAEALRDAAE
jgi:L-seryl-tRNA(Ser) seleniumtransferase